MMKQIKRIGTFLCSMKFAMILLLILAAACTLGSMIPQGEVLSYYTGAYSEQMAGAILLFGLDDVFHCGWFLVLTLFLCLNLLLCNVLHFPKLIRRMKQGFSLEKCLKGWDGTALGQVGETEPLFQKLGFRQMTAESRDGKEYCYASRGRIGIWGAWLCHLGMLVIIVGFGLGQMLKTEYTVYGVPGETKKIGDLNYELTIDDFEIVLREDDTVEQYQAEITVTDTQSGMEKSGSLWVNSPLSLYGMKFYQNSTGWASSVRVWKDGEIIQEELLCAGEYMETQDKEGLILMLRAFYPDYVMDEYGNSMTVSSALNNPAYVYALYYQDQMLGMNILMDGEQITVDEYTFEFHDPQPYTLIQVKRDPFTAVAALGGLMIVVALVLAFYVRPEEVWAVRGEDGSWSVAGKCRKAGPLFEERISEVCEELTAGADGQKHRREKR